jgi:hypothetical protein
MTTQPEPARATSTQVSVLWAYLTVLMWAYFMLGVSNTDKSTDKTNALIRADFERLETGISAIQPNLYQNGKPVDHYFDGHNWYDLRKGMGKR